VTLPALDWIFAALLLLSMALGAWRGLVYEVLSLINWVAAFVLAQWLAHDASGYLPMGGASESVRYAAGFVMVFVVAMMAGGLIAVLIKKLTTAVGLRPVDRVLGAIFGLTRGVLLLLLATVVVSMTPMKNTVTWQESGGVQMTLAVLKGLKPVLPRDVDRYLPV
jgi:membrane protein required for colicin V production